jgi:hypothetical protein
MIIPQEAQIENHFACGTSGCKVPVASSSACTQKSDTSKVKISQKNGSLTSPALSPHIAPTSTSGSVRVSC